MKPTKTDLIRGIECQQRGDNVAAERLFKKHLTRYPNDPAALYSLAVIFLHRGETELALKQLLPGINAASKFAPLWFAYGVALQALGRKEEALRGYEQALAINPDYSDALTNRVVLQRELQRPPEPRNSDLVLTTDVNNEIDPNKTDLIRGIECQQRCDNIGAEQLFNKHLARYPNDPAALYSLAVIFINRGEAEQAFKWLDPAMAHAPTFAPLWFAYGSVLQALGRKEEALQSYKKALELNPNYTEALINNGALLRELLHHHEALESFNRVLMINPDHETALGNCAILLTEFKESEKAIAMFARLRAINPNYNYIHGLLCYERLHICDWQQFVPMVEEIRHGVRAGKRVCKTLAFMALSDSAEEQYQCARIFSEHLFQKNANPLWQGERYYHSKIRIAYVSPDLREHPVGHLMAGILEQHDKSRFETFAVSLGIDDNSRLRVRMVKTFDHFLDARFMGSRQIAEWMREQEIDIAVDLAGFTSDSRTAIFSHRPAPVQMNYLGYPGTLAVEYMDYIIADRQIIPEDQHCYYSEKVVYLPDAYLPPASDLIPSERTPTRAECGLPDQGVVFCAFNHDYKISPLVFDIWMQLLRQVPNSVLWLMSRNELSKRNLQAEACARGVDANCLVFATRVPRVEDHLARYRQADLFLDTHPYNAHSTAADALLAGVPVVTYMGNAFPARVAGSLLYAIGMDELITHSLEEYAALALKLATNPGLLVEVKARLAANRVNAALFNTKQFCRNLENLYLTMVDPVPVELLSSIQPKPVTTKSLDLGCGLQPKNPFNADEVFGVDVRADLATNIHCSDLAIEAIPFADNSFDYVTAYDFLEHIPRVIYMPARRNAFVELMNEIYRVLKVDGIFLSVTPAYPQPAAFQDPTHVNIITDQTFPAYFDHVNRWAAGYGFNGAFIIQKQEWQGVHLVSTIKKVLCANTTELNIVAGETSIFKSQVDLPTTIPKLSNSQSAMVQIHKKHWNEFLGDTRQLLLYESWWNVDRVNFWRHTRLLSPVLEVLSIMKKYSWMTIGDGSGTDAWRLLQAGFVSVLATDLDSSVLSETQRRGYIKYFKVANAEALEFSDNSFDFILCKESLHHMNQPYSAVYEMLRVAKYGVVVIEPQDPWIDWPCRTDVTQPHYESVGNYVYQFSARELEKIAYGMNITGVATKTLVDVYIPDCEFALCNDADPIWISTKKKIEAAEKAVAQGTAKPNYILGVLFKSSIDSGILHMLSNQYRDWTFKLTNTNPYL